MSALARLFYAANRALPGAKALVPKPVHRFVLLRIVGANRGYEPMARLASRQLLEHELLPWLRDRYRRILFVGTAPYTWHYERLFRRDRDQYTTLDGNPGVAVWGAPRHIVAPVQEIGRHRPPGFFDCIVLNGVFGFGTDEPAAMRAVVRAVEQVLAPGGLLVVGWNTDQHEDPEVLGVLEPFFVPCRTTPWPHRVRFSGETHVYDFYERRSD